jgi:tripartite-type tricarboxylate transporter receptor subunit TctC
MKKLITTLLFALLPTLAVAFPDRPVRIILPVSVGSGPDVQLRKLAQLLSEKWNQPVLVENRPGGSGVIAMQEILKSPADGHVFGMFTLGDIIAFPLLYKNNLASKLQPIAPFFNADMALFVRSDIKNIAQLREEIKKQPMFGSWGIGSAGHVAGSQFATILEIDRASHVPYNNMNQWYSDTSRGDLTYGFTSLSSGDPMYRSGKINYLAIAANKRDPRFPDVPTVKELIGSELTSHSWLAFFGHTNLDKSTLLRLQQDLRNVIASPEMQKFIEDRLYIPMHDVSPADFFSVIERDRETYKKAIKDYNINLNQ